MLLLSCWLFDLLILVVVVVWLVVVHLCIGGDDEAHQTLYARTRTLYDRTRLGIGRSAVLFKQSLTASDCLAVGHQTVDTTSGQATDPAMCKFGLPRCRKVAFYSLCWPDTRQPWAVGSQCCWHWCPLPKGVVPGAADAV